MNLLCCYFIARLNHAERRPSAPIKSHEQVAKNMHLTLDDINHKDTTKEQKRILRDHVARYKKLQQDLCKVLNEHHPEDHVIGKDYGYETLSRVGRFEIKVFQVAKQGFSGSRARTVGSEVRKYRCRLCRKECIGTGVGVMGTTFGLLVVHYLCFTAC